MFGELCKTKIRVDSIAVIISVFVPLFGELCKTKKWKSKRTKIMMVFVPLFGELCKTTISGRMMEK